MAPPAPLVEAAAWEAPHPSQAPASRGPSRPAALPPRRPAFLLRHADPQLPQPRHGPDLEPPCPAAGTLTLNRLSLDKADVLSWGGGATPEEVLLWAALSARWANGDAIDRAVTAAVEGGRAAAAAFAVHRVVPFNPVDKMTSADVSAHCVAPPYQKADRTNYG